MYSTELYENLLQRQNSSYSLSEITKTLAVCGAFLLNISSPLIQGPARLTHPADNSGSDGYIISRLYATDSPTWSAAETSHISFNESKNDIQEAFNILKKLAFLDGDLAAENEADRFFSQVPVKTKKILISTKA